MKADIRDRLKRLGVHKGASHLRTVQAPAGTRAQPSEARSPTLDDSASQADVQSALWNLEIPSAYGRAFVRRTFYPLEHQHGGYALGHALAHPPHVLARLGNGTQAQVDLHDAIFLDTETTGLAGGTGTLVFLVGIGYFTHDRETAEDAGQARSTPGASSPTAFVIDQYFLPDPVEEGGMLCALDQCVAAHAALITFNGRGFDVPLLETRFTLARIAPALVDRTHLDLLMPARRAWRIELGSCSLGSLEAHMLDVRRDQQDIPGFLIPQLYREYLDTHDPADMQRVMYHNLHDILSMVTLVSRLCSAVSQPRNLGEYLAVGQYYESQGQLQDAVDVYAAALAAKVDSTAAVRDRVLDRLASCLKRQDHHAEAVPYWWQLANSGSQEAWLELAKYYEWRNNDLEQAAACSRRALALSRDPVMRAAINHRIERLARKSAEKGRA